MAHVGRWRRVPSRAAAGFANPPVVGGPRAITVTSQNHVRP